MAVMDLVALGLRAVQFVFAIISLGLNGYIANEYNEASYVDSPSRVNFLIFTSLWTILAVLYLALTPRFFPAAAHKFALVGVDAITMLFWFAGFIALAVFRNDLIICYGRICDSITASVVFGAFEWVLFTATTILSALHVFRTRGQGNTATKDPVAENPNV